ncbi:unnamed protein product [Adineta steineri]|uniref:G-protein coupled receptors family 1 profile domain-containing protein n=1 Tax=Adineta steineri TaxID=433720 RepID=A0A819E849_9BILA|nr:unnamed protein product [Adineta steineri]CAF3845627.1 unnamed protein product [Adineta steineri]
MSMNISTTNITSAQVSNTIVILNLLMNQFVNYLPLIFIILGFIGFVGNALTILQLELRSNTCCIYSLCGSIVDIISLFYNVLPLYLNKIYKIYIPWVNMGNLCKFHIFIVAFLPHLSINFLLMATIDRYASTCKLTSSIRHLSKIKMVPYLSSITIIFSCLASLRGIILYENTSLGCTVIYPLINNILYIVLNCVMQPVAMLIFVVLTFQNVQQSRQRAGGTNMTYLHHSRKQFITMIFTQVIVTAFILLPWAIMYMYNNISANITKTSEQQTIINFVYWLTNHWFYLNNVKSFYLSILTSRLFRQTFLKALIRLLPRDCKYQ